VCVCVYVWLCVCVFFLINIYLNMFHYMVILHVPVFICFTACPFGQFLAPHVEIFFEL